jgi:hypothetical protein
MRCKMAARYVLTDNDNVRAQEEWYRYQAQINEVDKSEIPATAPHTELCFDCGHTMTKNNGYENEVTKV